MYKKDKMKVELERDVVKSFLQRKEPGETYSKVIENYLRRLGWRIPGILLVLFGSVAAPVVFLGGELRKTHLQVTISQW